VSASILPARFEAIGFSATAGGRRLLDDVGFELQPGSRTVLLGPNGSGKTLLLRIAHGLLQPTAGRIEWQGSDPQREQAMVFERPMLLRRSVAANLDHALALRGIRGAERRERRDRALEETGLLEIAGQAARSLSAGERQRLALARVWALQPQVLFLDEPTSNLDPSASRAVEKIIDKLHGSGCKIVMSTHDLAQARRMADDVLFLNRGRLIYAGAATEFFSRAASRETEAFLAGELYWRDESE